MHDEKIGLVSIARCAELLTAVKDRIDRSALSRYCDSHGLKRGQQGRAVLVDFEEVREHRSANYTREVMSGQTSGLPLEVASRPAATVTAIPSREDLTRGLKEVQLRQALREEAEAEGQLTVTAEVDAGAADAIAALRASFAQVAGECAEKAAADLHLPSEAIRPLRSHFRTFARLGQERFAQTLAASLSDANEPGTEAHARLIALTAHALRLRGRPSTVGSLQATA